MVTQMKSQRSDPRTGRFCCCCTQVCQKDTAASELMIIPAGDPFNELWTNAGVAVESTSQLSSDRAMAISITKQVHWLYHCLVKCCCVVKGPKSQSHAVQRVGTKVAGRDRISIVCPTTCSQGASNIKVRGLPVPNISQWRSLASISPASSFGRNPSQTSSPIQTLWGILELFSPRIVWNSSSFPHPCASMPLMMRKAKSEHASAAMMPECVV